MKPGFDGLAPKPALSAKAIRLAQACLEQMLQRSRVAAQQPRIAFEVDGYWLGTVATDLAAFLAAEVDFMLLDEDALTIAPRCSSDINAALAEVAVVIDRAGRGGRWRNEALAVLTEDGGELGVIERAAVRPLGLTTQAVHLLGWTRNGNIWLQQRSLSKDVDPGQWDSLAGGLVGTIRDSTAGSNPARLVGESILSALVRESHEEAGVDPALSRAAYRVSQRRIERPVVEGYMVEKLYGYRLVLPDDYRPESLDGEASGFACVSPEEVIEQIAAGGVTLEASLMLLDDLLAEER